MATALDWVDQQVTRGSEPKTVLAVNPEKVMRAREDDSLASALNHAGLLLPDGIGVVLAVRALQKGQLSRVAGADLMQLICQRAAQSGHKIFLFGGRQAVNHAAAVVLRQRYPGIRIVGCQHGYIDESQTETLIKTINRSGADILFIALGSPRQEIWMKNNLGRLTVKVCQGIGGTLDVISGEVKRAPKLFILLNLEWLYRLLVQPARIFRQTALPRFAWQVLRRGTFG